MTSIISTDTKWSDDNTMIVTVDDDPLLPITVKVGDINDESEDRYEETGLSRQEARSLAAWLNASADELDPPEPAKGNAQ